MKNFLPVVYLRNDIGMGLGKMCSQGAHALMSVVTKALVFGSDSAVIPQVDFETLQRWRTEGMPVDLRVVSTDDFFDSPLISSDLVRYFAAIVDSGKTVFSGPTWTASLFVPSWYSSSYSFVSPEIDQGSSVDSKPKQRLVLCTPSGCQDSDVVVLAMKASVACLLDAFNVRDGDGVISFGELSSWRDWLEGSFTKIVLHTNKVKKFESLGSVMNSNIEPVDAGFSWVMLSGVGNCSVLATSPITREVSNDFFGKFSLCR